MLRFRDVCERISPTLFACAVLLYAAVVVRGSESPAQTFSVLWHCDGLWGLCHYRSHWAQNCVGDSERCFRNTRVPGDVLGGLSLGSINPLETNGTVSLFDAPSRGGGSGSDQ